MSTSTSATTPVLTVPLPAVEVVGYRGSTPHADGAGDIVGPLFGRLLESMAQLGLDVEQPTLAWYHSSGAGPVEIGVGLPSTAVTADDRRIAGTGLEPHTVPAADRAVVDRYEGDLGGLQQAWVDLHARVRAAGLTPHGPCREVYLSGDVTRNAWVIDLQQPVA